MHLGGGLVKDEIGKVLGGGQENATGKPGQWNTFIQISPIVQYGKPLSLIPAFPLYTLRFPLARGKGFAYPLTSTSPFLSLSFCKYS